MKKKKKNKIISSAVTNDAPFEADPLVEGDSLLFNELRVFTARNDSVVYTFREHFLYFPFENKKSKYFSRNIPPASHHIERRPDLKAFDFFAFRKNKTSVNLYRYSRENNLCDDLLEYISDNVESVARTKFYQHLTELRKSKVVNKNSTISVDPLFPPRKQLIGFDYVKIHFHKSKKSFEDQNSELNSFLNWFNNLNDELVDEVKQSDLKISLSTVETPSDAELLLRDKDLFLNFNSNELEIRNFIKNLLSTYFRNSGTKFKLGLAAAPSFGKTYLRDLFSGYNIMDLDDISMFDKILGPKLHKLVNARKWTELQDQFRYLINCKFKDGLILVQNSQQVPLDIPVISILTPNHLNRRKKWSDRSLFDTVIKSRYKIFVHSKEDRNRLVQILFEEIYNSDNYH